MTVGPDKIGRNRSCLEGRGDLRRARRRRLNRPQSHRHFRTSPRRRAEVGILEVRVAEIGIGQGGAVEVGIREVRRS